jgi:DNA-binding CsgD family transcriptional regulator
MVFDAMSTACPEAAQAARLALLGAWFDELQATWLLGRDCRVFEANSAARTLTETGDPLTLIEGRLSPNDPDGRRRLATTLRELRGEARFSWLHAGRRGEATLRLRAIANGEAVAATLVRDFDPATELAPRLARQFDIPRRQSELAAHLLAGHSLSAAAQAMAISRATANEHLGCLQKRLGLANRQAVLAHLLTACG